MNREEALALAAGLAALVGVVAWRSMPDPPKVRIGGIRIHHGLVGAGMFGLGVLSKKPSIALPGLILALDDIKDASEWFDLTESRRLDDMSL